jgi:hypothetical protein
MAGNARGSGQRSGLYSDQRFTNWSTHDPYWSEVETLPRKMRPRTEVSRGPEEPLGIFDRPLAEGFVRPWSIEDVASVLRAIPEHFLTGLTGVFLLGGTTRQRSLKRLTYGIYNSNQIFLFALPERMLEQNLSKMPKPNVAHAYTKFGVTITPSDKGGAKLRFDSVSLRSYLLYDVLLHEVGHHVDREHRSDDAERYATWFADFQHARLLED